MDFLKSCFTKLPNDFFDRLLLQLSGNEVKVYLVIYRLTVGYQKKSVPVSLSRIMKLTGISENTVIQAIKNLIVKNMVFRTSVEDQSMMNCFTVNTQIFQGNHPVNTSNSEVQVLHEEPENLKESPAEIEVSLSKTSSKTEDIKEKLLKKRERKRDQSQDRKAPHESNPDNPYSEWIRKMGCYHLTPKQIEELQSLRSPDFIRDKIGQLEYLLKHKPDKISGTARYLYCSIRDDWNDSDYLKTRKQESESRGKSVLKARPRQSIQAEDTYTEYVYSRCETYYSGLSPSEKAEIATEIEARFRKNSGFYSREIREEFYPVFLKEAVCKRIPDLLSPQDFQKQIHV